MTNSSQEGIPLHQEAGTVFGELLKYTGETITPALAGELALKLASISRSQEVLGVTDPQTREEALNNIALANDAVTDANTQLEDAVYIARQQFNVSYNALGKLFGTTRQAAQERWSSKLAKKRAAAED